MLRTLLVFAVLVPALCAAAFNRFPALLLYLWFALFRSQEWASRDISSLRLSLVSDLLPLVLSLIRPLVLAWPRCAVFRRPGGAFGDNNGYLLRT